MPEQTILDVGADQPFQTIGAAIAAANAMGGNADIRIEAGTYVNDGGTLRDGVGNVTIEGVGGMAIIRDPSFNASGKAAIVVGGQNVTLRNLDISGVSVPDANGAAIRYDGGTLVMDHVHFHDNQEGFLGAADPTGSILIENSEFDHNGTDAGNTHNIYVGDVASFTLTTSYIHDANVGHEIKSRAENNTIIGNDIIDGSGTSSYSIDLPNGGNADIVGNVIEQGANNENHTINAYGEEGNLHAGRSVTFSNNQIINDDPNGAGPVWNSTGVAIAGNGNTVWNTANLGSGVDPASFTALSSRPAIDLSALSADQNSTQPSSSATPLAPDSPQSTFRFFDTVHGTQFLTANVAERDSLLSGHSELIYEGQGMNAVTADPANPNVAPVFRFFDTSNGTHFFTTSAAERDGLAATRPDLVQEAATFAEHVTPVGNDTPVYRFFDSHMGDHFYTQSADERASILSSRPDMISEGIAFYAPSS